MQSEETTGRVYRELYRHIRPARAVTVFGASGQSWMNSALRMLENYSVTWGGAGDLLIPIDKEGEIHPLLWPLVEIFDADLWAVYAETLRGVRLADPNTFEEWLEASARNWVSENGGTIAQARTMLSADHILDDPIGGSQMPEDLVNEITHRTAPALYNDELQTAYFRAAVMPSQPLVNICNLAPLPNIVPILDTSRFPLPLRLLVAMRCGALSAAHIDTLERSSVDVQIIECRDEQLEALLQLCWLGSIGQGGVLLDGAPLCFPRSSVGSTGSRSVYPVPLMLSLVGCTVWSPSQALPSNTPRTVIVGTTAGDFAYALSLDRCGVPVCWLPGEWALGEDALSRRLLNCLARCLRADRPAMLGGSSRDVQFCSLSMARDEVGQVVERVLAVAYGRLGTDPKIVDQVSTSNSRVSLIGDQERFNEPLEEPFRGDEMLRTVPVALPSAVGADDPWDITWWIDVGDRHYRIPNRAALSNLLVVESQSWAPLVRSGRDGVTFHSHRMGLSFGGEPLRQIAERPRLRFPSASMVFRHLFEKAGYSISESAAGRYRRLTTDLWGGFDSLYSDLADDAILALLKSWLSETASGESPGIYAAGRRYLSIEDAAVASEMTVSDTRTLFDRYLDCGILRRGLVLKCTHCLYCDWYVLDDVGQSFICSRCRMEVTVVTDSWLSDHRRSDERDEPTYYYDLAEVVYQSLSHNSDLPIRVLGTLKAESKSSFQQVAEIDVESSDNARLLEVDLLALVDGRIIIGEAKTGDQLKNTKRLEQQWLNRFADVAEGIAGDEVVFATANIWREVTRERIEATCANRPFALRILELGESSRLANG